MIGALSIKTGSGTRENTHDSTLLSNAINHEILVERMG